jgi:hypothetical protein
MLEPAGALALAGVEAYYKHYIYGLKGKLNVHVGRKQEAVLVGQISECRFCFEQISEVNFVLFCSLS